MDRTPAPIDALVALGIAGIWVTMGLWAILGARKMQAQAVTNVLRVRRVPILGVIYGNRFCECYARSVMFLWITRAMGVVWLVAGILIAYFGLQATLWR